LKELESQIRSCKIYPVSGLDELNRLVYAVVIATINDLASCCFKSTEIWVSDFNDSKINRPEKDNAIPTAELKRVRKIAKAQR
jgi:hypothetical protein